MVRYDCAARARFIQARAEDRIVNEVFEVQPFAPL